MSITFGRSSFYHRPAVSLGLDCKRLHGKELQWLEAQLRYVKQVCSFCERIVFFLFFQAYLKLVECKLMIVSDIINESLQITVTTFLHIFFHHTSLATNQNTNHAFQNSFDQVHTQPCHNFHAKSTCNDFIFKQIADKILALFLQNPTIWINNQLVKLLNKKLELLLIITCKGTLLQNYTKAHSFLVQRDQTNDFFFWQKVPV